MTMAAKRKARDMAGRKKESFDRGRVEFLADPALIEQWTHEAESEGLNLSAYIRQVMIQNSRRRQRAEEREKGGEE